MSNPLGALAAWVTSIVHSLGYLGIGMLVALENLIPPIPSELILPLAGFLAGQGEFSLLLVVLVATTGSVIGALTLYGVGHWLGEHRVRHLVTAYGHFLLLKESDLDTALTWFRRHGAPAVLIGRLVPTVRSIVSVPAGLEGMPLWRFTLYTALGSVIWNATLVTLGWVLGNQWERVSDYAELLGYAVLAALLTAAAWFIWRRRQQQPS